MRPILVVLEYGKAEDAITPYPYNPYQEFHWPERPLSDQEYYDSNTPMAITSCRHMSEIVGVIRKYQKRDFDVVCLQYMHALQYLRAHRHEVFAVSASVGGFFNDEFMAEFKDDMYLAISAGNDGPKGEGIGSSKPYWTSIGAVLPTMEPAYYSGWGKGLVQFVGIAGEPITYKYFGEKTAYIQGTSYACPQHVTEIMNLMVDYYEKTGVKPLMSTVLALRSLGVKDLQTPGKDLRTGYGIFNFKPSEYLTDVLFKIGSKDYFRCGRKFTMDVAPFLLGGRTYVHVRFAAEGLNKKVEWTEATQEVTIGDIRFRVGVPVIYRGPDAIKVDAAPIMKDNRVFVPIRHIVEALGCKVEWRELSQEVYITK